MTIIAEIIRELRTSNDPTEMLWADEIERLQKESRAHLLMADQRQGKYCDAMKQVNELRAEIDRLRLPGEME